MPIVKKTDPLPERNVIVTLYGTPGSGKTSAAITAANPLLIDTDRGSDRAVSRCDTLYASKWQDVLSEKDSMKGYSTIVIDTAKACLDDFICEYVQMMNPKLRTNALKRFGQMAEEFKVFVSLLRGYGSDIVFVCHDKETQEGDLIRHAPDCTGQSKDLLLRISDQVGYVSVINGRRTISWNPMDNYVGKNVAGLELTEIPSVDSAEYPTFLDEVIKATKASITKRMGNLEAVNSLLADLRAQIASAKSETDATEILKSAKDLPASLKKPFFEEMKTAMEKKNIVWNGKKWESR